MILMANKSYTPSKAHFCFFIFCHIEWMLFVLPFMWNFSPASFSFFSIGRMNSEIYWSRAFFVAFSLSLIM